MTASKPLRIAIATGGRFHVLDLARELIALGHEVRFYSYVPKARALKFGLPARCHVSLLPFMWPLIAWERLLPNAAPEMREKLLAVALNRAVMARLNSCDVFIGMSGLILEAARFAKSKFGARIYVERGSRHIVSQARILEQIPGAQTPNRLTIERELAGYKLADRIAVASGQVVDSFLEEDPSLAPKLFTNPYGVDLEQFPQRKTIPSGPPTVLFVGGWTYRKGADVLSAALEQLPEARLIHVGGGGDVSFPLASTSFITIPFPNGGSANFTPRRMSSPLRPEKKGLGLYNCRRWRAVCRSSARTARAAPISVDPALAARIELSQMETRTCSPRQSRPHWRINYRRSPSGPTDFVLAPVRLALCSRVDLQELMCRGAM